MIVLVGYARVSSEEQTPDLQRDALLAAGVTRLHTDEGVSGAAVKRPGLDAVLGGLAQGDVLVVWKLDRLGRSLSHLIQVIAGLAERGVGFRSLTEAIDTTTPQGKLLFHIMGALAEFERSLIIERTRAGMVAAKKRGTHVGRPRALSPAQLAYACELLDQGKTWAEVARIFNVARSTLYLRIGQGGSDAAITRKSRNKPS